MAVGSADIHRAVSSYHERDNVSPGRAEPLPGLPIRTNRCSKQHKKDRAADAQDATASQSRPEKENELGGFLSTEPANQFARQANHAKHEPRCALSTFMALGRRYVRPSYC